jgi:hypothetical protein
MGAWTKEYSIESFISPDLCNECWVKLRILLGELLTEFLK